MIKIPNGEILENWKINGIAYYLKYRLLHRLSWMHHSTSVMTEKSVFSPPVQVDIRNNKADDPTGLNYLMSQHTVAWGPMLSWASEWYLGA